MTLGHQAGGTQDRPISERVRVRNQKRPLQCSPDDLQVLGDLLSRAEPLDLLGVRGDAASSEDGDLLPFRKEAQLTALGEPPLEAKRFGDRGWRGSPPPACIPNSCRIPVVQNFCNVVRNLFVVAPEFKLTIIHRPIAGRPPEHRPHVLRDRRHQRRPLHFNPCHGVGGRIDLTVQPEVEQGANLRLVFGAQSRRIDGDLER